MGLFSNQVRQLSFFSNQNRLFLGGGIFKPKIVTFFFIVVVCVIHLIFFGIRPKLKPMGFVCASGLALTFRFFVFNLNRFFGRRNVFAQQKTIVSAHRHEAHPVSMPISSSWKRYKKT